ncbi:hypothetical protein REMIM1_PC00102 (plasmid) [Rhizobium etli bv. mimosae str. Mim1]|nr:hypothetical protein REMIM1_PC00102 [Rhizobium etli bv. mimosae str. Mim1]
MEDFGHFYLGWLGPAFRLFISIDLQFLRKIATSVLYILQLMHLSSDLAEWPKGLCTHFKFDFYVRPGDGSLERW